MKKTDHIHLQKRDTPSESLWQQNVENYTLKSSHKIQDGMVYDSLIIGAGITGITTALILQKAGQHCIIAEAGNIGFDTTAGTSAHLNTFFDATYPEIEKDFSREAAVQVAKGGKKALSIIKEFVDSLGIDCDFEYKKAWLYAENENESKNLEQILEASGNAGITVKKSKNNIVPIPFESAILFEQQGQFHPLKYIDALAASFISMGGTLKVWLTI